MADFVIAMPVPFKVEGVGGTVYELPRLKDLSAEQLGELGRVDEVDGQPAKVRAIREFVQFLCPAIADEPLSDMGYLNLFKALAEGSGITLGES